MTIPPTKRFITQKSILHIKVTVEVLVYAKEEMFLKLVMVTYAGLWTILKNAEAAVIEISYVLVLQCQ